jgi:hypothetical protein
MNVQFLLCAGPACVVPPKAYKHIGIQGKGQTRPVDAGVYVGSYTAPRGDLLLCGVADAAPWTMRRIVSCDTP